MAKPHTDQPPYPSPSPPPTPPEPRPRLRRRRSRPLRIAAAAVVLVVAAGGVLLARHAYLAYTRNDPRDVVRAYFAAILAGETEKARAMNADRATDESLYSPDFLVPEAIKGDWWVSTVTLEEQRPTAVQAVAVLTGPPGMATARLSLQLDEDGNRWQLKTPYAVVNFGRSSLSYTEVNGVLREPKGMGQRYLLFPGFYSFYRTRPGYVDLGEDEGRVPVTPEYPGSPGPETVDPGRAVALGAEMRASANALIRNDLDDCTAVTARPSPDTCLFDGYVLDADRPGAYTWRVEAYPDVDVVRVADPGAGEPDWAVRTRTPGRVTVRDGAPGGRDVRCTLSGELARVSVGVLGVKDATAPPLPDGAAGPVRCEPLW